MGQELEVQTILKSIIIMINYICKRLEFKLHFIVTYKIIIRVTSKKIRSSNYIASFMVFY